jgi:hypothetical protein
MMRILMIGLLLPVIFSPGATAQYWAPLGDGFVSGTGGVSVVYGDTVWDRLLVGSNYKWMFVGNDTLVIAGVALWDGVAWDTLPARIEPVTNNVSNLSGTVWQFIRFEDDLYANGGFGFYTPEAEVNENFARWNNDSLRWEALECINPFMNGISWVSMIIPTDTMYLTGYRDSMCGYPESCVFKYDGNAFYPFEPFDSWPGLSGDYVGYVFWFQDQLYMTGLLDNSITSTFHGLLRYNGSDWEPVPGFEIAAPIKDVLIHDDKLYVCGYFFTNTGAPGNMVTVFDGTSWNDMGGGLRYSLPDGTLGVALDLHEWNDDIYVAGQFNYAGGIYAENAARWNGQQWCGLGGHYVVQIPGGSAKSLTTWRDTLYMAGNFVTIDGDTLNRIAKWLGQVQNCSPSVGLQDHMPVSAALLPVLIDAAGQWQVELPDGASGGLLYDMQGRLVQRVPLSNGRQMVVDLRSLPAGIYVLRALSSAGAFHAKLYKP